MADITSVGIQQNGTNVGIGTASPSVKLEVVGGNAKLNGITVGDDLTYGSPYKVITFGFAGDGANRIFAATGSTDGMYFASATGTGFSFRANGGTTNHVQIIATGNVGIGTTSPAELLEISGSLKIGNLKIQNSDGGRIGFNRNTLTGAIYNSSYAAFQINGAYSGANYLDFQNYNSSGSYVGGFVLNNGNVGIGTTSPNFKTHISTGDTTSITQPTAGTYGLYIQQNTSGNVGGLYIQDGATNSGNSIFVGDNNGAARFVVNTDGILLVGRSSGFTTFGDSIGTVIYQDATYIAASASEAIGLSRRTSDGNVAIFRRDTTTVGSISVNASATAFNTSSDYRLKQNLKDYNGLSLINLLKTYDFEWKADNTRSYGVIAHELQEVLPYAVTGEKNGEEMQGVDYSKLVPVLVKAIQEQQAQIEALKAQIGA